MNDKNENMYAAPTSEIYSKSRVEGFTGAAGPGRRFLNLLIDSIFGLMGMGFVLGFIAAFSHSEFLNRLLDMPDFVVGIVFSLLYYVPCEAIFGRTLGKVITGTKVIDSEGGKPALWTIIVRTLCRFLPFEALSFLGTETRGWHDSISKTYVVTTR